MLFRSELLKSWVRESYSNIAPKKLLAQLDNEPVQVRLKRVPAKKAAAKRVRK